MEAYSKELRRDILRASVPRVRTPKWAQNKDEILCLQAAQPDLTLPELQAALGTTLCTSTLSNALGALKLTFKKSDPCRRAGSTGRGGATVLLEIDASRH